MHEFEHSDEEWKDRIKDVREAKAAVEAACNAKVTISKCPKPKKQ